MITVLNFFKEFKMSELKKDPNFHPNPKEVEELTNEIDKLYKGLIGEPKDISIISEDDFVTGFLPYFAGEIPIESNKDFMATWIGIAGTPSSEVAVVDRSNHELFRVPAIIPTTKLKASSNGEMFNILEEYSNRSNQFQNIGNKFLASATKDIPETIAQDLENNETDKERWASILTRYNKKLPTSLNDNKEIVLDDDDLLEFD